MRETSNQLLKVQRIYNDTAHDVRRVAQEIFDNEKRIRGIVDALMAENEALFRAKRLALDFACRCDDGEKGDPKYYGIAESMRIVTEDYLQCPFEIEKICDFVDNCLDSILSFYNGVSSAETGDSLWRENEYNFAFRDEHICWLYLRIIIKACGENSDDGLAFIFEKLSELHTAFGWLSYDQQLRDLEFHYLERQDQINTEVKEINARMEKLSRQSIVIAIGAAFISILALSVTIFSSITATSATEYQAEVLIEQSEKIVDSIKYAYNKQMPLIPPLNITP